MGRIKTHEGKLDIWELIYVEYSGKVSAEVSM